MSRKSLVFVASSLLALTPLIAFAQQKTLASIIWIIIGYLNQVLVLMIGLAVVMFVWYVIQYFIKPNEDRTNAGLYVMYSLIGFFVILSLWGLVNILQNTFGLKNESNQPASWTSFKNLFPTGGSVPSGTSFGGQQVPSSPGTSFGGRQTPTSGTSFGGNQTPPASTSFGGNQAPPASTSFGGNQTPPFDPCPNGSASGPDCQ